ncbi:MAG: hypothetical protein CEE40_01075 [Chloroflexi bacterium B3_Chlor]|nr:MAG: hypothetical protein CEE40_01075 [Chloroflexi bacterium B3_Chlor]
MSTRTRLAVTLVGMALSGSSLACQCGWLIPWPPTDPLCAEAPFSPPALELEESDLMGTWEAHYRSRVDTLILKGDGSFKQVYRDPTAWDYVYETGWNQWWLERFADGRVRLHLQGARYYISGITTGELDGFTYPGPKRDPDSRGNPGALRWLFYDPFAHEHLEMLRELVLTVRVDSGREVLLHHMSYSSDEGFGLTGCQDRHFRRIDGP